MELWNNWEEDRDNVLHMIEVLDDNGDMLWQEDWFDLYDEHLVSLIESMDEHAPDFIDGGESWKVLRDWIEPCRDCWFQEDYFMFYEDAIAFAGVFANSVLNGVPAQMIEKFPHLYQ